MEMVELKREIGLFIRKEAHVLVFLQSSTETVVSTSNEADWPFSLSATLKGLIFPRLKHWWRTFNK
jgi:hypothetical protein